MPQDATLLDIEQQIGKLVTAYCARKAELDVDDVPPGYAEQPYVTCWAIGYEFTNTALEADQAYGRGICVPDGQSLSTSIGLGHTVMKAFDA